MRRHGNQTKKTNSVCVWLKLVDGDGNFQRIIIENLRFVSIECRDVPSSHTSHVFTAFRREKKVSTPMWWYRARHITSQRIHGRHRSIHSTLCDAANESARMTFCARQILFEFVHRWWADGCSERAPHMPGLTWHTLTTPTSTHIIMTWRTRVVAIPHHRINMNNLMKLQTSTGGTSMYWRRTTACGINYQTKPTANETGRKKKMITGKHNQHDDTNGHWAFDSDLFMIWAWIGTKINRNRNGCQCYLFYWRVLALFAFLWTTNAV